MKSCMISFFLKHNKTFYTDFDGTRDVFGLSCKNELNIFGSLFRSALFTLCQLKVIQHICMDPLL